jgi:hypothetical protein
VTFQYSFHPLPPSTLDASKDQNFQRG